MHGVEAAYVARKAGRDTLLIDLEPAIPALPLAGRETIMRHGLGSIFINK